ncbi:hypothetical protein CLAFUR0_11908 [Fulvia fulva]|nr:hypothetical protein CLAFUR0_11908 [Fulvia fulva]
MCKDYCCSAFLHFQDVIDPSVICDLDNNINPIFRPKNVSDEDYARAAPALRLASRALLTDAATKYLLTMSEGDIFLDGKTAKSKKALVKGRQVSWSEVDQLERVLKRHTDDQITAGKSLMRSRAGRLIANMTDMVQFFFDDPLACGSGQTAALEGPLLPNLHQRFPRGTRSLICISPVYFEELESPSQWARHHFRLAEVLLHELAHAVHMAVNGHRCVECFYKNATFSEAGYEFTSEIFGGILSGGIAAAFSPCSHFQEEYRRRELIIDGKPAECSINGKDAVRVPMLLSWPCPLTQKHYNANGWAFGARTVHHPGISKVTRLPMSWVRSIFTSSFWEENASQWSATRNTSRKVPWWLMGLENTFFEETGQTWLVEKIVSLSDVGLTDDVRERMQCAAAWQDPSVRDCEDMLDIFADGLDMWPHQQEPQQYKSREKKVPFYMDLLGLGGFA